MGEEQPKDSSKHAGAMVDTFPNIRRHKCLYSGGRLEGTSS